MTNTELTKIREDRKLSKKEFAALIGITPMLLGRYEKGSIVIPENVAEKLKEAEEDVAETSRMVKTAAKIAAPAAAEEISDQITAGKIEAKKTVRKADAQQKRLWRMRRPLPGKLRTTRPLPKRSK